jgi:Carboxypeptidase regulatory-like domain
MTGMLLLLFGISTFAVVTEARTTQEPQPTSEQSRGSIRGRVVDATTSVPIPGVQVSAQHLGDSTDKTGAFRIAYIRPGDVEVTAWRRDLMMTTAHVRVTAGQVTSVELRATKAPLAWCRLEGEWSVALVLDKSQISPPGTTVRGTVTFSENARDPVPTRTPYPDDPTLDEFGKYEVDLRPFFGEDIAKAHSNTVVPGGRDSDLFKEVAGYVHHLNAVEITFIPRMSHGGLTLEGEIEGDRISGTWLKRDVAPSETGHFLMTRKSK